MYKSFKQSIVLFFCFLPQALLFAQQPKDFPITSFGAIADGQTNNTLAIQRAIDAAAVSGGRVVVAGGQFVTGPIRLRTGVELHIEKEAALLGSTSRMDYGKGDAATLISADNVHGVAITGRGIINGRGLELVNDVYRLLRAGLLEDDQWKNKRPGEKHRPKLLSFNYCDSVIVTGITIRDGSGWVQGYIGCNHVLIDSITVNSTAYWNNDGIDIVNSKNVVIGNSYVDAADDAICLKSDYEGGTCENITVLNCKLRSSASAFKLGTGSRGGFRNITVRNLEVFDTYRSAIAVEAVDGGFLENIDIQQVKATNTGNAIFIRLGHRNKDSRFSTVKNVHIAHVYAEIPAGKPDKGYSMEGPLLRYPPGVKPAAPGVVQSISPWNHSTRDSTAILYRHNVFPASITGLPGHAVENVQLEDIEMVYTGGASKDSAFYPFSALSSITEAEAVYPEFSMFGELPCWGLYLRHINGISMKRLTLRYKKADFRTALVADDVKGLVIDSLHIPSYQTLPMLILNNSPQPVLNKLLLPAAASKAIKIY